MLTNDGNSWSAIAGVMLTTAVLAERTTFELRSPVRERSMTMKARPAGEKENPGTPITFVPANILEQRKSEIQNMIARRAYQHFEHRGRVPGHELEDWEQAETELLVYPCRHDLKESAEAIILHAELPGYFTGDELKVSVEARRLMVSGERKISVLCGDAKGTHSELRWQHIFRAHDLPADVDPSKATATLKGTMVEIVLPKASPANKPSERAKSASSGK
jgi:HSP20 family molecular chaperone IbpA